MRTDSRGWFRFSAVPSGRPTRLHVTAKGRDVDMTAEPTAGADADGSIIIRMDFNAERVEV